MRDQHSGWSNVPPPPPEQTQSFIALGDQQLAYRIYGVMTQNWGDTGGRSTAFKEYNYSNLIQWFTRLSLMDQHSSFIPFLASFYFSNVRDDEKLRDVIGFLAQAGLRKGNQNWRWLGQAIALARFELKDQELALNLAYKLADINEPDMPGWTKQMPAFILNNQGNKQAAYSVMLRLLQSNAETMHPNEVLFMRDYLCTRLQTKQQAEQNPLCKGVE